MSGLAILSIAVLGKHGNPLFLESYSNRRGGQADLKWHYAAHTALDFFEERGVQPGLCPMLVAHAAPHPHLTPPGLVSTDAPAYKTTDSYLGMLYAMEDYAVYAITSLCPFSIRKLTRCRSQLRLSNQHAHQVRTRHRARRRSHPRHRCAHGACHGSPPS